MGLRSLCSPVVAWVLAKFVIAAFEREWAGRN